MEKPKFIKYVFNGKNKKYFPDFYLKHKNLIIEIKSTYTYNLHLELNQAKHNSCIEQGYNHEFIIDKDYSKLCSFLK